MKVLIIGAGAAGITAGHLLAERGIDFEILEAELYTAHSSDDALFAFVLAELEPRQPRQFSPAKEITR